MRRSTGGIVIMLAAVLAMSSIGCSGEPAATAAVSAAQTAFDAVKDQAAKVVPEETKALSDAIAAARANVEAGKFKEAMEAAKALPGQATQLAAAASKKKDELTASWTSMSTELPQALDAVQTKVDALAKSKRLPKGLDKTQFEGIQSSLASAKQMWTDAQAAFTSGNLADAMSKLGSIKSAIVGVMTALGMQVPAALQAS